MDIASWLLGLRPYTVVIMMVLLGLITVWVFRPGRKKVYEDYGRIPFVDDDPAAPPR